MKFKTKTRDSQPQRSLVVISKPSKVINTAIKTLQPQVEEQLTQQKINLGWQRLEVQAERINQLSTQLETAIQELKVIANDLNYARKTKQATPKPVKSVCQYLTAVVPHVKHQSNVFILTTRPVDLLQAEREAIRIAEELRQRAKKKVARQANQKQALSSGLLTYLKCWLHSLIDSEQKTHKL